MRDMREEDRISQTATRQTQREQAFIENRSRNKSEFQLHNNNHQQNEQNAAQDGSMVWSPVSIGEQRSLLDKLTPRWNEEKIEAQQVFQIDKLFQESALNDKKKSHDELLRLVLQQNQLARDQKRNDEIEQKHRLHLEELKLEQELRDMKVESSSLGSLFNESLMQRKESIGLSSMLYLPSQAEATTMATAKKNEFSKQQLVSSASSPQSGRFQSSKSSEADKDAFYPVFKMESAQIELLNKRRAYAAQCQSEYNQAYELQQSKAKVATAIKLVESATSESGAALIYDLTVADLKRFAMRKNRPDLVTCLESPLEITDHHLMRILNWEPARPSTEIRAK